MVGLDRWGKSRPHRDPRTVQPVGSRYTDDATRPTLEMYVPLYVCKTENYSSIMFVGFCLF